MRILLIAITSVVLFFPTFWLFNAVVGPNWGAGIAAVGMYIGFPIIALRIWRNKEPPRPPSMEQALATGQLAQSEYDVTDAVAVEEFEDEGLHYFLALQPNKTLFLGGQYLYDPVERAVFPSTRLRVYWHSSLGLTYGVECLGQPLTPSKNLPSFTLDEIESLPADRHLFDEPLQAVVDSIKKIGA
ncbi:MAG: hypothetical protein H7Y20_19930 [Bryobacteraceae bacterium]|nr:hypothetical protein [Bryobacteraceae bacterium]